MATQPAHSTELGQDRRVVPSTVILVDHALERTFYKGAIGTIVIRGPENPELFGVIGESPPPASGASDPGTIGAEVTIPVRHRDGDRLMGGVIGTR